MNVDPVSQFSSSSVRGNRSFHMTTYTHLLISGIHAVTWNIGTKNRKAAHSSYWFLCIPVLYPFLFSESQQWLRSLPLHLWKELRVPEINDV